jgi:selenocysteine-specific elongation factor
VLVHLDRPGRPVGRDGLVLASGLPPATVDEGLQSLSSSGEVLTFGDPRNRLFFSRSSYDEVARKTRAALEEFHASKPLAEGIAKETLKKRMMPDWDARTADIFMDALVADGTVEGEGKLIRLPGTRAAVTSEQASSLDRLVEQIESNPVSPPTVSELASETGQARSALAELLGVAEKQGRLIRVSPELYFSSAAMADIEAKLRAGVGADGITVSDFRGVVGTSRKYALPLLEYFDRARVTARVGDVRKLR